MIPSHELIQTSEGWGLVCGYFTLYMDKKPKFCQECGESLTCAPLLDESELGGTPINKFDKKYQDCRRL